jgi:hypothetical protein
MKTDINTKKLKLKDRQTSKTEMKTDTHKEAKNRKTGRQVKQTHEAQTERQTDKKSRNTNRHT